MMMVVLVVGGDDDGDDDDEKKEEEEEEDDVDDCFATLNLIFTSAKAKIVIGAVCLYCVSHSAILSVVLCAE